MSPRTLIVTGGAGFIGSSFIRSALEGGDRVVCLDAFTYAGHAANLAGLERTNPFELVTGDITDGPGFAALLARVRPDAVLNFAAESHVDNSIVSPGAFVTTNVVGTFTLLNAVLAYWKSLPEGARQAWRFVQISTDEVYGSLGPTGHFSETTPYAPNSPYSATKAAADHLVRAWHHTYGLPTLTTNCSNNYGPRQFPEKLIPRMITCALRGEPLPIYGDGKNVRDWIHVEDHCAGILLALSRGKPGETYCFGGRAERDNVTLVHALCRILDELRPRAGGQRYEELIRFVPDRAGHDRRYAIDDSRAERELGFTRRYSSFEQGLRATVEWYLANGEWLRTLEARAK